MNRYPTRALIASAVAGIIAACSAQVDRIEGLHEAQRETLKQIEVSRERGKLFSAAARARRVYARGGFPAAKTPTTPADHARLEAAEQKRTRKRLAWALFCLQRDA